LDDDLTPDMSPADMPKRIRDLAQGVATLYQRFCFSGLDELLQRQEVCSVGRNDEHLQLLAREDDAPVRVGELQVWELVNETGMDHPFHLHGFFFQVIAIDGAPTVPSRGRIR
jgi:hypothetical protein